MTASRLPTAKLVSLAALFATSGLLGCPSASTPLDPCAPEGCDSDPVVAIERYRDLLVLARPREAFTWIHPDAAEGLDANGFAHLFERHGEALIAQAEELVRQARASAPRMTARVRTDNGEVIVELTPEGWRLQHPVPGRSAPVPE